MSALEVRRLVLTIVTVVEHWRDCDVILPIFNDTGELDLDRDRECRTLKEFGKALVVDMVAILCLVCAVEVSARLPLRCTPLRNAASSYNQASM